MFETDALHRRGKALEDEFFHRVDKALRAKLLASMERDQAKSRLAAATGFQHQGLLDHMADAGFEPTTVAALALIPIVWVAWADGTVTPQERQLVMHEALRRGLNHEPSAFQLIESWLHVAPPKTLWTLWQEYAAEVRRTLSPTLADVLVKEILQQAQAIAEASGGKSRSGMVTSEEQAILDDIAATFN